MAIVSDPAAASLVLPTSVAAPPPADDASEDSSTTVVGSSDGDSVSLSTTASDAISFADGSAAVSPADEAAAPSDEDGADVSLTPSASDLLTADGDESEGGASAPLTTDISVEEADTVALTPTEEAEFGLTEVSDEEVEAESAAGDSDPTSAAATAFGDDDDSGATVFDTVDVEA